jgi:hypothetical protein
MARALTVKGMDGLDKENKTYYRLRSTASDGEESIVAYTAHPLVRIETCGNHASRTHGIGHNRSIKALALATRLTCVLG